MSGRIQPLGDPLMAPTLQCGEGFLDLSRPAVMGILNLTPDSFYAGSRCASLDQALRRMEEMIEEGADIIDLGAESARPYAQAISLQEEIDRILEVLVAAKSRFSVLLSVDTYKPEVMQEAIQVGVNFINDIYALQQEGALAVVAQSQVAVVLMHMQGTPAAMQDNPCYGQVVADVTDFLVRRAEVCVQAGIDRSRLILDPGFGFGKTTAHNLTLLKHLHQFKKWGFPILVGLSRKSSIGEILSQPAEQRLYGSLAAQVMAATQGASIIRTHDIKPTAETLKIVQAVLAQETAE